MTGAVGLVVAVILYQYLSCKVSGLRELIDPFEYRSVGWSDLPLHITEHFRRGGDKSGLVIVEEETGRTVRIVKTFENNSEEVELRVVADGPPKDREAEQQCARELQRRGCDLTGSVRWTQRSDGRVECPCGMNSAKATEAARVMLAAYHGLDEDRLFRVRVRGRMSWREGFVNGRTGGISDWKLVLAGKAGHGKPYKWWHLPNAGLTMLHALGGVVHGIYRRCRGRPSQEMLEQQLNSGSAMAVRSGRVREGGSMCEQLEHCTDRQAESPETAATGSEATTDGKASPKRRGSWIAVVLELALAFALIAVVRSACSRQGPGEEQRGGSISTQTSLVARNKSPDGTLACLVFLRKPTRSVLSSYEFMVVSSEGGKSLPGSPYTTSISARRLGKLLFQWGRGSLVVREAQPLWLGELRADLRNGRQTWTVLRDGVQSNAGPPIAETQRATRDAGVSDD